MHENFSEKQNIPLEISSKEQLQQILNDAGIDTSLWGIGKAKKIDHLFKEIEDHECTLTLSGNEIIRKVNPLRIHVFYKAPDGIEYELSEQHQTFLDNGRMRERNKPAAVGEKIIQDELLRVAAVRALHEELGIEGPVKEMDAKESIHEEGPSSSYPGLTTIKDIYPYEVYLSDNQYNPSGYVELQDDKVTCFNWKKKE